MQSFGVATSIVLRWHCRRQVYRTAKIKTAESNGRSKLSCEGASQNRNYGHALEFSELVLGLLWRPYINRQAMFARVLMHESSNNWPLALWHTAAGAGRWSGNRWSWGHRSPLPTRIQYHSGKFLENEMPSAHFDAHKS